MPDVCIQHMIAIMLIDKTATFRSAHDKPRMQDPAVLRQRAKVRLDPAAASLVTVTLTDGTRLAEDVKAVLGTVNNPMTREQVVAKCSELMTPIVGAAASAKVVGKTLDLDNMRIVRELRVVLQRTAGTRDVSRVCLYPHKRTGVSGRKNRRSFS